MKKNVGNTDRIIRFLIGIALGYLVFSGTVTGIWTYILGFLTFSIPLSGLLSYCPLYTLFGINSCPMKSSS